MQQRIRQIHLDFHTGPDIPDVGLYFDKEKFGDTLSKACVDSVTLFAKCHHGHLYYDTKHPARHPNLRCNLLEEQISVLRERGIRTPIYFSVLCDEYAANQHPEWVAVNPDGSRVGRTPFDNSGCSWQILDTDSPYFEYLCSQIAEVMDKFYPVDGLFFDMCWDQPSVSKWTLDNMVKIGLAPENLDDQKRYARQKTYRYMEKIIQLVSAVQKEVPVWFNSRPISNIDEEKKFFSHIELEALPTGKWGYTYFPVNIRHARNLLLPVLGMTGRFHKSWADFGGLRSEASLLYDCVQSLAHGAGCSIGDQLHPSGSIEAAVYERIGRVYEYIEQCDQWCKAALPIKEVAVLYKQGSESGDVCPTYEGIYRAFTPLGYQYAFLCPEANWEEYPVVVIPECVSLQADLRQRLEKYKANGGRILLEMQEGATSSYTVTYLRFSDALRGQFPAMDHVFYEKGLLSEAGADEEVLAWIVEPYFERSWKHFSSHFQTPPSLRDPKFAAATAGDRTVRVNLPIFRAYAIHGNAACRQLAKICMERLLPEPFLRLRAPSYVEAVANRLNDGSITVHLLSFIPQKKSRLLEIIDEAIPARNIEISIRVTKRVKRVLLQPENRSVHFVEKDGRTIVVLEWIEGHKILVFE